MPKQNRLDKLELAAWRQASAVAIQVTRYAFPASCYRLLESWTRQRAGRSTSEPTRPSLYSLPELLAWFLPEVSFVGLDSIDETPSLQAHFLGDRRADTELHARLRKGIFIWLDIVYANEPVAARKAVADQATRGENWTSRVVSPEVRTEGRACPVPVDPGYWDAFVSTAVDALNGKPITVGDDARLLVKRVGRKGRTAGVELIAYPPSEGEDGGWWSEVLTLTSASFPEKKDIFLLARTSMRNWGRVERETFFKDKDRSLDVFLPPESGQAFLSFGFRAERREGTLVGCWAPYKGRRVFDVISTLAGRTKLSDEEITAPVVEPDGLWVLPRMSTGNRDADRSGGSGMPWPDRAEIVRALDDLLGDRGFVRADPVQRRRGSMPIERPFALNKTEQDRPQRRRDLLLKTLRSLGCGDGVLRLAIFFRQESTSTLILEELREFLGEPEETMDSQLRWACGLTIQLVTSPSGPLADALASVKITREEESRYNPKQLASIRGDRQRVIAEEAGQCMAAHILASLGPKERVTCAIVEMPDHRRSSARDPYPIARRRLAMHNVLAQVVLAEDIKVKARAAFRDCLRMLGVAPSEELPSPCAAITVLRRNREQLAGGTRDALAQPIAISARGGVLRCALPDHAGMAEWMPYALANLRIFRGEYSALFERPWNDESIARFGGFFARVLHDLNDQGETLVLAEAEAIRANVPHFRNAELIFDQLRLGEVHFRASDLPNLRIARLSTDFRKQPYYFHDEDIRWTAGVFAWTGQRRTGFSIKGKARTVGPGVTQAMLRSRHAGAPDERSVDANRMSGQLDEVCMCFLQREDDPWRWIVLVDRLREVHGQYDDDTRRPFPLHEVQVLGKAFTYEADPADHEADEGT